MFDEGKISSPIKIKKISVNSPQINFFSDIEFKNILSCVDRGFPYAQAKINENDKELFVDAYSMYWNTGMRLAEPFNNELKYDGGKYKIEIFGSTTKNTYLRYVHLTEQQGLTVLRMNEWLNNQLKTRKDRYQTIKVFSRVFSKALKQAKVKGKFHDLRRSFATRLYFLTGEEFTLCHALGHRDTSMTKQYTNVDKVILASAYPKIHNEKNKLFEQEYAVAGYKKRDTILYSNFGFTTD
tara:strand:- start:550 stop:1266 length:717 start_codon:yes stop_codon:yes gene_type:complete